MESCDCSTHRVVSLSARTITLAREEKSTIGRNLAMCVCAVTKLAADCCAVLRSLWDLAA